jgi:O-antigen/teichoic acid export membrane protein
MPESLRAVATGSVSLVLGQYGAAALGLAATAAMAHLLGPADFGLVALAMAYPELVIAVLAIKSSSVTTRYLATLKADRRFEEMGAVCKIGVGLDTSAYLVAFAIVMLSSRVVADVFFSAPGLAPLMMLYALSVPLLGPVPTAHAVLSVTGRFGWLGVIQVGESALRLVLTVALITGGGGVTGAVIAVVAAQSSAAIAWTVMAWWALSEDGVGAWWRAPVKRIAWLRWELGATMGWNYLMVTLRGLMAQLPLMWLGRVRGPEEAGYFRLATTIVTTAGYVEAALGRVASPILATRMNGQEPRAVYGLMRAWTVKLGLPLMMGIAVGLVSIPLAVPAVFGERFAGAVPTIQLALAGTLVSGLLFWVNPYYFAAGQVAAMTGIYVASALVALAAAWGAVMYFGAAGLAAVIAAERAGFALALLAMIRPLSRRPSADATTWMALHRLSSSGASSETAKVTSQLGGRR